MSSTKCADLTTFKALSFDCYGTLIDWESGFITALDKYFFSGLAADHALQKEEPRKEALQKLDELINRREHDEPTLLYNKNLSASLEDLAKEYEISLAEGAAVSFGNSIGTWTAFSDTVPGLLKLAQHYKLIILSNVDNANIASTTSNHLSPAEFDALYTAEDIGSYKPDLRNFRYLFEHAKKDLGIDREKGDLLHIACSLRADHAPAKEIGLRGVWISRPAQLETSYDPTGKVAYEWRFDSIGEFADEVERQFVERG